MAFWVADQVTNTWCPEEDLPEKRRAMWLEVRPLGDPPGGELSDLRNHTGLRVEDSDIYEARKEKTKVLRFIPSSVPLLRAGTTTKQEWDKYTNHAEPVFVGYTTKSDEEICRIANLLAAIYPIYSLLSNNCQHFVDRLRNLIWDGEPWDDESDSSSITKPAVEIFKENKFSYLLRSVKLRVRGLKLFCKSILNGSKNPIQIWALEAFESS